MTTGAGTAIYLNDREDQADRSADSVSRQAKRANINALRGAAGYTQAEQKNAVLQVKKSGRLEEASIGL
jgi:hypothetical protein